MYDNDQRDEIEGKLGQPADPQTAQDLDHLRILSIFHYILGGMEVLFGCFPVIHLGFGIVILAGGLQNNGPPMPAIAGLFFVIIAAVMMLTSWALAIITIVAGQKLATRRSYTYCLVVAALECLFIPFGTILGVFTLIVLTKPSVKVLFGVA